MAVTTLAGRTSGAVTPGFADGDALLTAMFYSPYGLAINPATNVLYVMDTNNSRIRALAMAPGPFPVCDNRWHHCALTLGDGGAGVVKAYVDGALAGQITVAAGYAVTSTGGAHVAWGGSASVNGGEGYTGVLADLRAYGRALSAAEVAAIALPVFAAAPAGSGGASAPTAAPGVTSYAFSCPVGSAGIVTTYAQNATDLSWAVANYGASTCSVCGANTFANAGVGCTACPIGSNSTSAAAGCKCQANTMWNNRTGVALACAPCATGATSAAGDTSCTCGANYIASGAGAAMICTCPSGYVQAGSGPGALCVLPCAANTYSAVVGGTCVPCPIGGVSGVGAQTCTCGANSTFVSGFGATLVCRTCPSNAVSLGGCNPCTCIGYYDYYDAPSNTCITPASSTASATPSFTPSTTSTISVTPTPSSTVSASSSRTATQTPTQTPSNTGSNSASPSVTPSVTPVPDVRLSFAFAIGLTGGGALRPSDLASSVPLVHAIAAGFASLLRVAEAQVGVRNFTDVATGAVVAAAANPAGYAGSRRRLGAAPVPGSQGVSVSLVVILGKTPTELETMNMQAALTATSSPQLAALQTSILSAVSAATTVQASYFKVSAPTAVAFANSPFIAAPAAPATAAASGSDSGSGLGVGLCIAAAVAVLACAVWSFRSWRKHGVLPCCRDRARERRNMLSNATAQVEVDNALAQAEAIVGADLADDAASKFGGGAAANKKALAVKRLVEKAKAADAELAAIKLQLKKKDEVDADEVAQLRAQLKAAKEGRSQPQAFGPQSTS